MVCDACCLFRPVWPQMPVCINLALLSALYVGVVREAVLYYSLEKVA